MVGLPAGGGGWCLTPLLLMVLVIGGCETGTVHMGSSPSDEPSKVADVDGLAVSRSDVAGLADSILTSGSVLFFPTERAAEVAAAVGLPRIDPHTSFSLEEHQLARLGGRAAAIGRDGRFPVPDGGSHLVCLADTFAGNAPGPPYSVVGCAEAEAGDGVLSVSLGEGGVEAVRAL